MNPNAAVTTAIATGALAPISNQIACAGTIPIHKVRGDYKSEVKYSRFFRIPIIKAENIPAYLKKLKQWVMWIYQPDENGRLSKVPYQPNGRYPASSSNPKTWSDFETCVRALASGEFDGIGFCFARGDGLAGIDLDHCFNSAGELEDWAQEIVNRFSGTYIERSPSGDGLHIWCLGKKTGSRSSNKWPKAGCTNINEGAEVYDSTKNRYLTVTGDEMYA